MAQWIKTDGTIENVKPAAREFTNAELHEYVIGGLTGITLTARSHIPQLNGLYMWIDDEAIKKSLPYNEKATEELYTYRKDHAIKRTRIYGDVLITTLEESGDE